MGALYLLELADILRGAGLQVWEADGWRNRARSSGGYNAGSPGHIMIHHTASPPSSDGWPDVGYMTYSHPDAPLCNLYLDRSGAWYVCAAGATNTNGTGSDPCGHIADDTMNTDAIGIEAGNDGIGEVWPGAQLDSYVVGVDTLCAVYGIPPARIHGHAEWAPTRKIDPAGPPRYATGDDTWDMDLFRADVAGTPPTPPSEDDDMRLFTCPGDPARPHVLVGPGWRKIARTDEEVAVMENAYGPAIWLDARNYDVVCYLVTQGSDGWP